MMIPPQTFMDGNSKIYGGVHCFHIMSIDATNIVGWPVCVGKLQSLASAAVELLHLQPGFHCNKKWQRYHRVISLQTQVGITSQKNKWANTDPRIYRRWDQVPRRSKHPLSTGHACHEPSFMIMNAALSAVKVSVPSTI
jgi:hypothetical protein